MNKRLNDGQIESYRRNGFLFPLAALTPAEAATYRRALEDFEHRIGGPVSAADRKWRARTHLLFDWAQRLVRHPAILDAVEDVIGPDILVYTTTFFVKEPGTPDTAAWHQDATFFGLEPDDLHVTAWLALSEASGKSGCMEFLRQPERAQLAHRTGAAASVNGAGQHVAQSLDIDRTALGSLHAGEFSLHNTLTVHRSGPNLSHDRRIGIGISYIPTRVRYTGSARISAHLVRGTDRYGHFDLDPAPSRDFDADAVATHDRSYSRYNVGYAEQVRRHASRFGVEATPAERA